MGTSAAWRMLVAVAFAVATPASCALTVSYDGYERLSDADGAAGSGGLGGCFPVACGSVDAECGTVPDGCGDSIKCGACQIGKVCSQGNCSEQPECGNTECEGGENCATCPQDCPCGTLCFPDGDCCAADCSGKSCGPDGCGKLCGGCPPQMQCENGQCVSAPACGDGPCDPATGETCETCLDCLCPGLCLNATCCASNCTNKTCGPDGCGNFCPPGCPGGEVCNLEGQCQPQATCGNSECEVGENCNLCGQDCHCAPGETCSFDTCCKPDCNGKACGSDGCGSICGQCGPGFSCDLTGTCVGCGDGTCDVVENCGSCPTDCVCPPLEVCTGTVCCTPSCGTNDCGPNGCGNPTGCGTCQSGQSCVGGKCQSQPSCGDKLCNSNETCLTCPGDCQKGAQKCCPDGTIHDCCVDTDCMGDISICAEGFCNAGTCDLLSTCLFPNCCNFGLCEDCGGGGIGGFGGIGSR